MQHRENSSEFLTKKRLKMMILLNLEITSIPHVAEMPFSHLAHGGTRNVSIDFKYGVVKAKVVYSETSEQRTLWDQYKFKWILPRI